MVAVVVGVDVVVGVLVTVTVLVLVLVDGGGTAVVVVIVVTVVVLVVDEVVVAAAAAITPQATRLLDSVLVALPRLSTSWWIISAVPELFRRSAAPHLPSGYDGGEPASSGDEFRRAVGAHLQCSQIAAGGIPGVTRRLIHASGRVEIPGRASSGRS